MYSVHVHVATIYPITIIIIMAYYMYTVSTPPTKFCVGLENYTSFDLFWLPTLCTCSILTVS